MDLTTKGSVTTQSWHAHGSETREGGGTQDLRYEVNWCVGGYKNLDGKCRLCHQHLECIPNVDVGLGGWGSP